MSIYAAKSKYLNVFCVFEVFSVTGFVFSHGSILVLNAVHVSVW